MFADLEESCISHPEGFWCGIGAVMHQGMRRVGMQLLGKPSLCGSSWEDAQPRLGKAPEECAIINSAIL